MSNRRKETMVSDFNFLRKIRQRKMSRSNRMDELNMLHKNYIKQFRINKTSQEIQLEVNRNRILKYKNGTQGLVRDIPKKKIFT